MEGESEPKKRCNFTPANRPRPGREEVRTVPGAQRPSQWGEEERGRKMAVVVCCDVVLLGVGAGDVFPALQARREGSARAADATGSNARREARN
ncbi:unnamed protein product [Merluccius merluccius]